MEVSKVSKKETEKKRLNVTCNGDIPQRVLGADLGTKVLEEIAYALTGEKESPFGQTLN